MTAVLNFISVDIRSVTPILLAALGLLFMERSGVVNIGAEGMMLIGALAGVMGSKMLGDAWLGVLFAMIVTGISGLIFAYFVVTLKTNQIVVGIAFNLLGLGLTTTVSRVFFGTNAAPPKISSFKAVFMGQSSVVYLAIALVFVIHFFLYKTDVGLKIRAVGENPRAADTVGINVDKIRYLTILMGSMLIGFGGAFLSLGMLSFFTENMVSGRGFIALAVVIFGKYTPIGVLLAALLFGVGNAAEYQLQAAGSQVPYQFLLMIPYLLTILTLAGFVGKVIPPAASGKPYYKE